MINYETISYFGISVRIVKIDNRIYRIESNNPLRPEQVDKIYSYLVQEGFGEIFVDNPEY